jgi:hypothetical protein
MARAGGSAVKFLVKVFGLVLSAGLFALTGSAQNAFAYKDQPLVKAFEKRAMAYDKNRRKLESRLPKVSKAATPEEIAAFKLSLQKSIQSGRATSRQGEFFTPTIAEKIRQIIKAEFKGWEASELRKTVLEAETSGVPVKINVPYPDAKELVAMPPTLLLSLPQLPKALRYRFIQRNLVILDRDNALIIDFMPNALP